MLLVLFMLESFKFCRVVGSPQPALDNLPNEIRVFVVRLAARDWSARQKALEWGQRLPSAHKKMRELARRYKNPHLGCLDFAIGEDRGSRDPQPLMVYRVDCRRTLLVLGN
jgi:hypothetical protein